MRKISVISLVIAVMLFSFFAGLLYFPYKNLNFEKSQIGVNLKDNRKMWGTPDKSDENQYEIVDTYYPMIPLNEYKFFFSKKDSLLIGRWKDN